MSHRPRQGSQSEDAAELRELRRTRNRAEAAVMTARAELCEAKGLAGLRRPEQLPFDHAQYERDRQASIQNIEAEEADRLRRGRQEMAQLETEKEIHKAPQGEIIGIIEDGELLHFSGAPGSNQISKGAVLVKWWVISVAQPMPDFISSGLEPDQVRIQGQHIEGEPALGAKGRLIPYLEGSNRRYVWGFEVGAD